MQSNLNNFIHQHSSSIEEALDKYLPRSSKAGTTLLNSAIEHAVFTGGKRMRPLLCLASAQISGHQPAHALKISAALEYLHSASLIYDDLPCMDASIERRGNDPVYLKFGENVALLAALALLNQTYALFSEADVTGALMLEATRCIGTDGMIAGQLLDLKRVGADSIEGLETPYLKTSALLKLALTASPIALGAPSEAIHTLALFGHRLGMAYQLLDDALDKDEEALADINISKLFDVARQWLDDAGNELIKYFDDDPATYVLREFCQSVLNRAIQNAGVGI